MPNNTSKPITVAALLVVVWSVAYWLYEPSGSAPPITFGDGPQPVSGPLAAAETEFRPMSAETVARPEPVVPQPAAAAQIVQPQHQVLRVVPPTFREYTVQKGDVSIESIARRLGGGKQLAEGISRANPFVTPNKLIPGRTVLRIPLDPGNVQGKIEKVPEPTPAAVSPPPFQPVVGRPAPEPTAAEREYVVQAEDTLSGVAKKMYDRASMWQKIYEANRDRIDNPDRLKPGTRLRIPAAPAAGG